jgi:hypothetical protein
MAQQEQSLRHHARWDPLFHFFLGPISFAIVITTIVQAVQDFNWHSVAHIIVAIWATVAIFKIRLYALKVQDRVIRLEERVRLKELAPASFQGRIGELSVDQCVGLRFASDAEVADLAQKALAGNWSRKQIKEVIRNWRPDNWRV